MTSEGYRKHTVLNELELVVLKRDYIIIIIILLYFVRKNPVKSLNNLNCFSEHVLQSYVTVSYPDL